ncbi:MAG: aminodeoxychorismate synthase component I [Leadbetterella sp.]|nr:aminodeoxychorismate synthase component I [Leadbetterella sp.]
MPTASDTSTAIRFMNKAGQDNRPFLFVISYDRTRNYMVPLEEADPAFIRYDFSGKAPLKPAAFHLGPEKIDFDTYREAFQEVRKNLMAGNSFLTNLTVSTPVSGINSLEEVFESAHARYKLWVKGQFACFSPETFVTVSETGEIATFPMKGTLDAGVENAAEKLRSDKKEFYEHTTIVDLLRNDLSRVADRVRVERFQYMDRIRRQDGSEILQMSSEIRGQLPGNWKETLGTWFFELLPAGSICGAPKPKTLDIIKKAEKTLHAGGERGFYSGVCGVFDGRTLTSAVMIRFIEQTSEGFDFKSGGGITHLSEVQKEYDEIYEKVYVPVK